MDIYAWHLFSFPDIGVVSSSVGFAWFSKMLRGTVVNFLYNSISVGISVCFNGTLKLYT